MFVGTASRAWVKWYADAARPSDSRRGAHHEFEIGTRSNHAMHANCNVCHTCPKGLLNFQTLARLSAVHKANSAWGMSSNQ